VVVRDAGTAWHIVLQTEHGELAAQFARAWSPRPEPFHSLEIVTRRHDDGWFVWERGPTRDPEGRPANFLDVPVALHLAFYRAAIVAVTAEDPYAGLILSMHGAGIYKRRYGLQDSLRMRFVDEVADEASRFVEEQEAALPRRLAQVGIDEQEAWRHYKLLQVWDRLSLYACLTDLEAGARETIVSVPLNGSETTLELTPRGPHRVAVDPYPFAGDRAVFSFERRVLRKREWADDDEFREDFFGAGSEQVTIAMERP
jgi:hypothetical protein